MAPLGSPERGFSVNQDRPRKMVNLVHYLLSPEELASWEAAFDQGGHRALTNKARPRGASPTKIPS